MCSCEELLINSYCISEFCIGLLFSDSGNGYYIGINYYDESIL